MINGQDTNVNDIVLVITIVLGIAMILLPRRYATIPVILVATYITMGQVLNISSMHFTLLRLILLFGWGRLLLRRELFRLELNMIDKTLLAWVVVTFITHNILYKSSTALINQLGFAYNTIGLYFLFRALVRDFRDLTIVVRGFAIIVTPLAFAMVVENITGRNLFAFLGGVPELSEVRGNTLRSQGSFDHPILAGTFGASLLPLFCAFLFAGKRYRFTMLMGSLAATTITLTSGSVGPLVTYICGIAGMAAWFCRRYLRQLLLVLLLTLVGLQLTIKQPVWHLFDRLGDFTDGTIEHRTELIDQAIEHFDEWWLLGTTYTAHWMSESLPDFPDKADITNQYIDVGVNAGLLSLLLFSSIIVLSFMAIGKMVQQMGERDSLGLITWALGVVLFSHAVSFMSVTYFDQMIVFWYLLIATISSLFDAYMNTAETIYDSNFKNIDEKIITVRRSCHALTRSKTL